MWVSKNRWWKVMERLEKLEKETRLRATEGSAPMPLSFIGDPVPINKVVYELAMKAGLVWEEGTPARLKIADKA